MPSCGNAYVRHVRVTSQTPHYTACQHGYSASLCFSATHYCAPLKLSRFQVLLGPTAASP
jgi:hypothetical protein